MEIIENKNLYEIITKLDEGNVVRKNIYIMFKDNEGNLKIDKNFSQPVASVQINYLYYNWKNYTFFDENNKYFKEDFIDLIKVINDVAYDIVKTLINKYNITIPYSFRLCQNFEYKNLLKEAELPNFKIKIGQEQLNDFIRSKGFKLKNSFIKDEIKIIMQYDYSDINISLKVILNTEYVDFIMEYNIEDEYTFTKNKFREYLDLLYGEEDPLGKKLKIFLSYVESIKKH